MMRLLTFAAACAASLLLTGPAHALGALADVRIIDRETGRTLPMYRHGGQWWVAGTPGSRYAIALQNRTQGRVLTVISVDGVNAISGETASWDQTGYVLAPWRSAQISGWRKSTSRVAAFEFTSVDASYAARTGRPEHVGVIGVAVFRERPRPEILPIAPPAPRGALGARRAEDSAAAPAAPPDASKQRDEAAAGDDAAPQDHARAAPRLGTGHGRHETSRVTYTDFVRARPSPDDVVTIHYDSHENLVAMGVIPRGTPPQHPAPSPFPGSPGFVPDPPH